MTTHSFRMLISGLALAGVALAAMTIARAAEPAPGPAAAGVSLDGIVTGLEQKYQARVTDIELERKPWGDYYEIELEDGAFSEWDVVVDARDGKILREHRDRD